MTVSEIRSNPAIAAVDLFCGAGGLSHGLLHEDIAVKAGFDVDPICKYAYEYNNGAPYIIKDVAKLSGKDIKKYLSDADFTLIAGCAPCQPFSTYTHGKDNSSDSKWGMLYEFSRLVQEVTPHIVTMENVPQLVKHDVFNDFVTCLENVGYYVSYKVVFCPDYGIPQTRQRLVLLASQYGHIELINPDMTFKKLPSVRDAIGHLPPISHGQQDDNDPLHKSQGLSDINVRRIQESKPDGSWKDWSEELVAECHKKEKGATYGSVYGRMSWDKPAPTITTQFTGFGNGRFGHPEQDRALSLREGAILQTFPENYEFVKPGNQVYLSHVAKMIGNAVPVTLGKIIAKSIKIHLRDKYGKPE
ncbi:MAG: DNA (cytosine-5-)-methyltransferase [Micavibrio sp.]|nr:MAG: DNA (cytosine-5-)-methyltransferase [Micavibrio sp.]